jgi:membrane fusion protein, heavy metal efflux system
MLKLGSRKQLAATVVAGTGIWVALLLLGGCTAKTAPGTPDNSASAPASNTTPELFSVPQEQMGHIKVITVAPSPLPRVLRLTGSVTYNSFETTPVFTQTGGHVSRILVEPGEEVHEGQPMLYVESPDYAQLRAAYVKARDAFALADKNYARSKDLYEHRAIAEADLLASESARTQAQADSQAAEQALAVLGITNLDEVLEGPKTPELAVLAPISGEVVERLVAPGQVVQAAATQVFTISNVDKVWVLANVYERDLADVRDGDRVTIQTDAYPNLFRGQISYIAPALDPNTRTLQARIVADNRDKKLKKDMYVTVTVDAGTLQNALTVPDAAVLRTSESQPFVYVATGSNQFSERLVSLGEIQGGATQITEGLQAGDRVVADGSLFLQFANSLQR